MTKSVLVSIMLALLPASLFAVDGVVLINQAALNAAGGTYTITSPGSYKLSGNLVAKDQNTNVIVIATDHVTIDLNGFAILGTANCSGGFPCVNHGSGNGISTHPVLGPFFNITVRNGTIQGMGSNGILLNGDSILVEYTHVRSNGDGGMVIFEGSLQSSVIVQHNNVHQNGGRGVSVGGGQITDNVVSENGGSGIQIFNDPFLPTGIAARNVVTVNRGYGLNLFGSVNYIGNSMSGNTFGPVSGGFNLGQNLCGGAACPSAMF
ncbi:MAG TPA: right-handed parallel beta-helix repeat-containing protein [Bryobacteraceae bacterium]|nr:right-handed parallel beta-helix repeat-containing protein [Bryobacteraceae bacterium]